MRTYPKQTNLGKAPRFAIRRIERGHAPAGTISQAVRRYQVKQHDFGCAFSRGVIKISNTGVTNSHNYYMKNLILWVKRGVINCWNMMAPYGYEDATGFHYGEPSE